MVKEVSEHRPAGAVDRVFLLEEGEFLGYLGYRLVALVYGVFRKEGKQSLLYISDLIANDVVDVELLTEAEDLALNLVFLFAVDVVYEKSVSPGKDLLL